MLSNSMKETTMQQKDPDLRFLLWITIRSNQNL